MVGGGVRTFGEKTPPSVHFLYRFPRLYCRRCLFQCPGERLRKNRRGWVSVGRRCRGLPGGQSYPHLIHIGFPLARPCWVCPVWPGLARTWCGLRGTVSAEETTSVLSMWWPEGPAKSSACSRGAGSTRSTGSTRGCGLVGEKSHEGQPSSVVLPVGQLRL